MIRIKRWDKRRWEECITWVITLITYHTEARLTLIVAYPDVNRRRIEITEWTFIFNADRCLNVHNVPFKFTSLISG